MTAPKIGIEFISVFGLPPIEFVQLAAGLDVQNIAMGLQPFDVNPHNYPTWSLLEDKTLRRDFKTALKDHGVSISLAEGCMVLPQADIKDVMPKLEVLRDLGASHANIITLDPDLPRCFDQLSIFTEGALELGLQPVLEFGPIFSIPNIEIAQQAIQHVGGGNLRLVIDLLHFIRAGHATDDLTELAPDLFGYVQLCDGPMQSTFEEYLHQAKFERLVPGDGDFPIGDILGSLPRNIIFGIETPMYRAALAGIGPKDRLSECVQRARKLLIG